MKTVLLVLTTAVALAAMGCAKDTKPAKASDKASEVAPATPEKNPHAALLSAYEALRKALVNDDLAATKAAGKALAAAAKGQPGIAEGATKVDGAADLEAARLAFGVASKALITLISSQPGMEKGLHAFTCPMAKGYKKWVQNTDAIDNPYMGQRMLKCGGPTAMEP